MGVLASQLIGKADHADTTVGAAEHDGIEDLVGACGQVAQIFDRAAGAEGWSVAPCTIFRLQVTTMLNRCAGSAARRRGLHHRQFSFFDRVLGCAA